MPRAYYRGSFWAQVTKGATQECWWWIGTRTGNGYGAYHGRGAHVWAYVDTYGEILPGLCVCHHCDEPLCVNPAHLFLATTEANQADKVAKNRQAKGERIGTSRLTAAEVRQIRVLREAGLTLDAIAEAIGVSRGAVNHVVHGRHWTHVESEVL